MDWLDRVLLISICAAMMVLGVRQDKNITRIENVDKRVDEAFATAMSNDAALAAITRECAELIQANAGKGH